MSFSADYITAWSTLNDRYSNKRVLVVNHFRNNFDVGQIHSVIRKTQKLNWLHLEKPLFFKKLKGNLEEKICGINSKLDAVTTCEWEQEYTDDSIPNYKQLEMFLKNKCSLLKKLETIRVKSPERRINSKTL